MPAIPSIQNQQGELPTSGAVALSSRTPPSSTVKNTPGVSRLEPHPEAQPPVKAETCPLLSCLTYIKDKIVSFFKWICSCCYGRSATQQEIQATRDELQRAYNDAIIALMTRFQPDLRTKDKISLVLAASIEAFTLSEQINSLLSDLFNTQTISSAKLQATKKKTFELVAEYNQVKLAERFTPELQKKIEDFSLEKVQISSKNSLTHRIGVIIGFLSLAAQTDKYENEYFAVVNDIRQKNNMPPVMNDIRQKNNMPPVNRDEQPSKEPETDSDIEIESVTNNGTQEF